MTALFEGSDWDFALIKRIYDACEEIAVGEMGLSIYPNRLEIITSEQMLDAYASVGMPLYYKHWSFGKHRAFQQASYEKGFSGLAYEIVINSSPCISYLMEGNSAAMQTLVIAHAAFGHNHFFKNNTAFKQWTDATSILDYLQFAQNFVRQCEEKHGPKQVELLLDAAHALMPQAVNRTKKPVVLSLAQEERRQRERALDAERTYNDLWARTTPAQAKGVESDKNPLTRILPEENILYFMEKYAPKLKPWERELLRIVRKVAQYFYAQGQTKVMNEGCATFVHYEVMHRLREKGLLTNGAMLELLHSHSSVVSQPEYDSNRFSGFNPYALGFAVMQDIKRVALTPTEEDREWFRNKPFVGCGDYMGALKEAWANFRDESFIMQYLSPKVMRDFKLFCLQDNEEEDYVEVTAIQDDRGYRKIRSLLAAEYLPDYRSANIEVSNVDLFGDRTLELKYVAHDDAMLNADSVEKMLPYVASLWRYDVHLLQVDTNNDQLTEDTYTFNTDDEY